jgi:hypothetical protein
MPRGKSLHLIIIAFLFGVVIYRRERSREEWKPNFSVSKKNKSYIRHSRVMSFSHAVIRDSTNKTSTSMWSITINLNIMIVLSQMVFSIFYCLVRKELCAVCSPLSKEMRASRISICLTLRIYDESWQWPLVFFAILLAHVLSRWFIEWMRW